MFVCHLLVCCVTIGNASVIAHPFACALAELTAFEEKQVKIDGGPSHKWQGTPSRATPPQNAIGAGGQQPTPLSLG